MECLKIVVGNHYHYFLRIIFVSDAIDGKQAIRVTV